MFQNNPLLNQLKEQFNEKTPQVKGIIIKQKMGYYSLKTNEHKTYFIPHHFMKNLMLNDRISATLNKNDDNKIYAKPEELLEPGLTHFSAKLIKSNNSWFVQPIFPNIDVKIPAIVSKNITETLNSGDYVIASLKKHAFKNKQYLAEIIQFVAKSSDPFYRQLVILEKYGFPTNLPKLDKNLYKEEKIYHKEKYTDLTHLPFFTIDNKETFDMDDAIFIEKNEHNDFIIHVAISDPSAYFENVHDLLDLAQKRVFSHYLPGIFIPMLPADLNQNLCSLFPDKNRAVIVCKIFIDKNGQFYQPSEFDLAIISSKNKLTYDEVTSYLEEKNISFQSEIQNQLDHLYTFFQIENKLFLSLQDHINYRFILDKQAKLIDIATESKTYAHKIIEEIMILTNYSAAIFLVKNNQSSLFINHDGFETKHLNSLVQLTEHFDLTFSKNELQTLDGFLNLKQEMKKINDPLLNARVSSLLTHAKINNQATPHFGLGLDSYLNWTAPLRKYNDFLNQQNIKRLILNQPVEQINENILEYLNQKRKNQRLAMRELYNLYYFEYFSNKLNQDFLAEIIEINRGGIRAKMLKNGAIAFIPYGFITKNKQNINIDLIQGAVEIDEITYKQTEPITITLIEINEEPFSLLAKLASN